MYSIKRIVGRVVDQFTKTNGNTFSPLTLGPRIRLPLTKLGVHSQFQFAQTGLNNYELRLTTPRVDLPKAISMEIITGLKIILGQDANIKIVYVNTIPARPSGKRPLYVNESVKMPVTS